MQTVFPVRTQYSTSVNETGSLPGLSMTTVSVISPEHSLRISGISLFPYLRGTSALSLQREVLGEGSPG